MSSTAAATRRQALVMLAAAGSAFLAMLDSTVVNLAIPNIRHDMPGTTVTGLSWVVSGYAVVFAALLAPSGKLADALGRQRLFIIGTGLFTVASLLCALSPDLPVLIATRAAEGAGAAAMIPASLTILLIDGPAGRQASSIGLWSAASAAGAAVGPSIGGLLVEAAGWRSVFLINLPLGAIVVLTAIRFLPPSAPGSARRMPDLIGTTGIAVGLGVLTLGVTEGASWGWGSPRTIASLVIGPATLCYAVLRSRRQPVPAIDTVLWASRAFRVTNVVSLLYGMAQYPFMLVSVLYLTGAWHYSELRAGLAMTPGGVSAAIVAVGVGRLAARLGGPRTVTLMGLAALCSCAGWLSSSLPAHPAFLIFWLPAALLAGLGMGAATMGTSAAAAMSAAPAMFAGATGLNTTCRQFGGALGIAAMATILSRGGTASAAAPYGRVYAFCCIVTAVAIAIAAIWLRLMPRVSGQDKAAAQQKINTALSLS
jgi:EmrB/QacA subfamily drug resistance transporter